MLTLNKGLTNCNEIPTLKRRVEVKEVENFNLISDKRKAIWRDNSSFN